ncbi:MAG: C40 family peptidase [Lachnospiraceae bacterium]|nr:C40 family peptidase [Lachnospiraceae bacterium]
MRKKHIKKTALLLSTTMILGSAHPAYAASVPFADGHTSEEIVYVSSENDDPSYCDESSQKENNRGENDRKENDREENSREEILGSVDTASGVTEEMCHSEYWYDKNEGFDPTDPVLETMDEIQKLNEDTLHTKGTNMNDLENMPVTYNALKLKETLANCMLSSTDSRIWGRKNFYADQKLIDDSTSYCLNLYRSISENGYDDEEREIQYAVAVKRTPLKIVPVAEYIGFSATDGDDENINSAINVNEPFIIKQKTTVSGNDFYWGYSDNCTGWVDANDLAVCKDKDEWLDAWKVDPKADDFVIVTQNQIRLEPSVYIPDTSEVKLTFATILKSVPKDEMPDSFIERGSWNNYVVYLPTRDEDGKYVKRYAFISQHYDVHEGYLPMTRANIMDVAFNSLGDRYGWGGMLDSMDCSLFTRNVYKCFGLYLPRNTSWQQLVPGRAFSLENMTDEQKLKAIYRMPTGTLLYFPGHTTIYTGTVDGMAYVISDTGSLSDSVGEVKVNSMYSVLLNPLSVRRRNGTTWLSNITTAVMPISKENYDLVLKNIADDAAGKNDKPEPEPAPTPEKTKRVSPMKGQSFASSSDTLALDTFHRSIKKLYIDFTNVKASGVDTLSVSCIKKSVITTKVSVNSVDCDRSVAKVKIDKKNGLATVTLKKSGTVTFNMTDGSVYKVNFTVDMPKAQKSAKTIGVSANTIKALTVKDLFGTQIDGGKLYVEKDALNNSSVSGNTLLVNAGSKNKLKISYEYLDKKYRISVKVK